MYLLLQQWLTAFGAFLLSLLILSLLGRLLRRHFEIWTQKTKITWDDELLLRLGAPLKTIIVLGSFIIGAQFIPPQYRSHIALAYGLKIGLVVITVWIINRVIGVIFRHAAFPVSVTEGTRTLLLTITRTLIFSLTLLVVLDTVGISITPILASLGIGSVAIALALQDTLSNLFSGFYILIDRPVRLGDYIKLSDGVEGIVKKIGWRSTHIHQLAGNVVVIPNSKMSASVLTNFDLPNKETGFGVAFTISYDNDLKKVEELVHKTVRETMTKTPGSVPEDVPVARFSSIGGPNVELTVYLKAKHLTESFALKHEIIKAVHAELRQAGVQGPVGLLR